MSGLRKLIHEIHRRSLWQVLGIYVVASWVALQVVDVLANNFGLPEWFPPFAVALLILGLPIVLATAFVQEGIGTQAGSRAGSPATPASAAEPGEASQAPTVGRRLFTWRNALLGGVGAFALWGVVAAGWVLLGGAPRVGGGPAAAGDPIPSIAALPFENLSPDEENRYFADGMHDEVVAQLAQIESMRVVSRQSVLEYRESEESLPAIAEALGVRYVLEATVSRAADRVRIRAQLIDADVDRHIWSDTYERQLADVFAIQADVARRIADALGARLAPEVQQRIATAPTTDTEAYSLYLKGKLAYPREESEEHFRAAIQLDPDFAAAHAWLSQILAWRYWWQGRDAELLERARESAELALTLAPDLPDAHLALGYAHYRALDYEMAEPPVRRALELRPNDARSWSVLGHLVRRQGRFEEAADAYERSAGIDLRSAELWDMYLTYLWLRRAEDARRTTALWRAVRGSERLLVPDAVTPLKLEGDTAAANAAWASMAPLDSLGVLSRVRWIENRRLQRDGVDLLAAVQRLPELWEYAAYIRVRPEYEAEAHAWMDDAASARAALDSARALVEEGLRTRPADSRYVGAHARILAALGEREASLAAGDRAVELVPLSRDAINGAWALWDLAQVHTLVGDPERAIELLEQLLSIPSEMTSHVLRLDPTWDPLRDHPRFQRLIEEGG